MSAEVFNAVGATLGAVAGPLFGLVAPWCTRFFRRASGSRRAAWVRRQRVGRFVRHEAARGGQRA